MAELIEECATCGEVDDYGRPYPESECPDSKRACGHHCNCSWVHDHCHWCDAEFGEFGAEDEPIEGGETGG